MSIAWIILAIAIVFILILEVKIARLRGGSMPNLNSMQPQVKEIIMSKLQSRTAMLVLGVVIGCLLSLILVVVIPMVFSEEDTVLDAAMDEIWDRYGIRPAKSDLRWIIKGKVANVQGLVWYRGKSRKVEVTVRLKKFNTGWRVVWFYAK